MGRPRKTQTETPAIRKIRPALTPEARENQLISLAYDLAEKRLLDGSASSQEVTHFLKMGSVRAKLELEKLRVENELTEAKKANLDLQQHSDDMYRDAIKAMQSYTGEAEDDRDADDYSNIF